MFYITDIIIYVWFNFLSYKLSRTTNLFIFLYSQYAYNNGKTKKKFKLLAHK